MQKPQSGDVYAVGNNAVLVDDIDIHVCVVAGSDRESGDSVTETQVFLQLGGRVNNSANRNEVSYLLPFEAVAHLAEKFLRARDFIASRNEGS